VCVPHVLIAVESDTHRLLSLSPPLHLWERVEVCSHPIPSLSLPHPHSHSKINSPLVLEFLFVDGRCRAKKTYTPFAPQTHPHTPTHTHPHTHPHTNRIVYCILYKKHSLPPFFRLCLALKTNFKYRNLQSQNFLQFQRAVVPCSGNLQYQRQKHVLSCLCVCMWETEQQQSVIPQQNQKNVVGDDWVSCILYMLL
jgi:hypothetical protein